MHICLRLLAMASNQTSDHVADEVEPRAMESNQSSDHVADEVEPQFVDAAKVATREDHPGAFQLLDMVTIEAGEVVCGSPGPTLASKWSSSTRKAVLASPSPQTSSYLTRPPYESVTMWKYLTARNGSGLS